MLVHSLWDQEDIYGAIAVYKAIKPLDKEQRQGVSWCWGRGTTGRRSKHADSLRRDPFRIGHRHMVPARTCLRPFLARYLKDDAPAAVEHRGSVTAYRDRQNRVADDSRRGRLHQQRKPLYLQAGFKLSLLLRSSANIPNPASTANSALTTSTSPTPRSRCPSARGLSQPIGYAPPLTWAQWLVDDQREASGRTDVLTYTPTC